MPYSLGLGRMLADTKLLVRDFNDALRLLGKDPVAVEIEPQIAMHQPPSLCSGKCAAYVFSLSDDYGAPAPAGPHRVLKVGRVGPNSNARFQSQHYSPRSSRSNLANSLLTSTIWMSGNHSFRIAGSRTLNPPSLPDGVDLYRLDLMPSGVGYSEVCSGRLEAFSAQHKRGTAHPDPCTGSIRGHKASTVLCSKLRIARVRSQDPFRVPRTLVRRRGR